MLCEIPMHKAFNKRIICFAPFVHNINLIIHGSTFPNTGLEVRNVSFGGKPPLTNTELLVKFPSTGDITYCIRKLALLELPNHRQV